MTAIADIPTTATTHDAPPDSIWRQVRASRRILIAGGILGIILILCLATLPLTLNRNSDFYYNGQKIELARQRRRALRGACSARTISAEACSAAASSAAR